MVAGMDIDLFYDPADQPGTYHQQDENAEHRVGLPDYACRDAGIVQVIQNAGIQTLREVTIIGEIHRIKKDQQKGSQPYQEKGPFPTRLAAEWIQGRKQAGQE